MTPIKTDENGTVSNMPLDKFAPTRTDSNHIGSSVKKLIDLMLAGKTFELKADGG